MSRVAGGRPLGAGHRRSASQKGLSLAEDFSAVSDEDVEVVEEKEDETSMAALQAEMDSAQAAVDTARDELGYTTLRAPFGGVVSKRYVDNYQEIRAKEPIVSLDDVSSVEILVDVPELIVATFTENSETLVQAVADGKLQAFEFATPVDDYSQLFNLPEGNPGTVGNRYLHFPGWQQQFLITYMIINKKVWDGLSPAQQALVKSVARDHVLSSYGETLRKQGETLQKILTANDGDGKPENDLVLVQWPEKDLALLRNATIRFLNAHALDKTLSEQDRKDFAEILESLRAYVGANSAYWKARDVPASLRFQGWKDPEGKKSWEQKLK